MARFGAYSEFGKLREVVVGSAQDLHLPPFGKDLSHYNDDLRKALVDNGNKPLDVSAAFPDLHKRTVEQIENVAATYKDAGIKVHRPRAFTHEERIHLGVLQEGWSQLYPADPVFVIGKHFLELSIRRAYRRKEVFPLRDIVEPLIDADPEAHYVAMPPARPWAPSAEGPGPFLEGGDILITGRDIIVGYGHLCSNLVGVEWLKRYIERWDYRVHPMPLQGELLHGLGVLCLLREGLAMAYLPALAEGLPEPIRDWEVIELTYEEAAAHATVGVSLDRDHYMIDPGHNRVIDELCRHGVEPVPTPCDQIGYWGGAIRCITLPLSRDD